MRYKANQTSLGLIIEESDKLIKDLPQDDQNTVRLIIEEAVVNVIRYASSPEIDLDIQIKDKTATIRIKDWGKPFDPTAHIPNLQSDVSINERTAGGLGIFFIKKMVDEMNYEYLDGANCLTLIKRLKK